MKTTIKIGLSALLIASAIQCTQAAVPIPKGWYANGSAGLTNTADDNSDGSNQALGFNINAGYKFIPFFGIEAGFSSYGSSASSFTGNQVVDFAVLGIIPFVEMGGEIFAKLGGADIRPKSDSNVTGLYYGFGGNYYFTPNSFALVQWTQAKGGGNHLNLFSIGMGFLL